MNNNHSGLFNRNVFRKSPEYDFISYFRYGFSARNIPPDSNNRFSTEFWIVSIRRFSRSPNSSHLLKSCPDVLEPKQTQLPCEVSASSLYTLWVGPLPALLNGAAGIRGKIKRIELLFFLFRIFCLLFRGFGLCFRFCWCRRLGFLLRNFNQGIFEKT